MKKLESRPVSHKCQRSLKGRVCCSNRINRFLLFQFCRLMQQAAFWYWPTKRRKLWYRRAIPSRPSCRWRRQKKSLWRKLGGKSRTRYVYRLGMSNVRKSNVPFFQNKIDLSSREPPEEERVCRHFGAESKPGHGGSGRLQETLWSSAETEFKPNQSAQQFACNVGLILSEFLRG